MIKVSNRDGKVEASVSSDFMALYIAVIIIIIIIIIKARKILGDEIRKYIGSDFGHCGLVNRAAHGTFYSKSRWSSGSVKYRHAINTTNR